MLTLVIAPFETYMDDKNEFITFNEPTKVQLEHSLVSVSKWESKWHKPYLITNDSQEPPNEEQTFDYIKCMIVNDAPFEALYGLKQHQILQIKDYIDDPMTATTIRHGAENGQKKPKRKTGEIITSELIYYWMSALQIPFQPCENWHLNRLLTLIEVANIKNNPDQKKMSNSDILKSNRQLNAARRAKHHTKG